MMSVTGVRFQMGCGEPLQSRWRFARLTALSVAIKTKPASRGVKPVSAQTRQGGKCKHW
jgi:hypothetical protein